MTIEVSECNPCNHLFHSKCLDRWLNGLGANSRACPICRRGVEGNQRCFAHRTVDGPSISPLVVKNQGAQLLKHVSIDKLEDWRIDHRVEKAVLESRIVDLTNRVGESTRECRRNQSILALINKEIERRDAITVQNRVRTPSPVYIPREINTPRRTSRTGRSRADRPSPIARPSLNSRAGPSRSSASDPTRRNATRTRRRTVALDAEIEGVTHVILKDCEYRNCFKKGQPIHRKNHEPSSSKYTRTSCYTTRFFLKKHP